MTALSCAEVREEAAELALGALPGSERAAVLGHLDRCADCRRLVEELSDAADALLLLAPEADPPPGFSRRVVSGFAPAPAKRRWRPVAVSAAAVIVAILGVGAVIGVEGGGAARSNPPFAIQAPGVHMASFRAAPGEQVQGQVWSQAGGPAWVFMTVRDNGSGETYHCQLELTDGQRIDVGSFQMHGGTGSWGREVPLDLHGLRAVRLVDGSGATAAVASLA